MQMKWVNCCALEKQNFRGDLREGEKEDDSKAAERVRNL